MPEYSPPDRPGERPTRRWNPQPTATGSGLRCWRGWPAARSARPVEGWSIEQMEKYAAELKLPFPLENYWTATPIPDEPRYLYDTFKSYTLPHLNAVPCDDDVGYTLLSLFIAEESGKGRAFNA